MPIHTKSMQGSRNLQKDILRFLISSIFYVALAIYLYQPHLQSFQKWQLLLPISSCLGALGCYIISCRWVSSSLGSFFAGLLYGFGPFMLSLSKFHPIASVLVGAIPWLFWPAVYIGKKRWRWLSIPFSFIPFLVVLIIFHVLTKHRLFAVPIQNQLCLYNIIGLISPLSVAEISISVISIYHVPIAALAMGISMMVAARRSGIIIILAFALLLGLSDPLSGVSPIIWMAIPILGGSILAGLGLQGLVCAGSSDSKWVLASLVLMIILTAVTYLLATERAITLIGLPFAQVRYLSEAGKMYLLGSVGLAIIYFATRAKLRIHWLRWAILAIAIIIDVFLGARQIVDIIQ